jgi:hypothetical protein
MTIRKKVMLRGVLALPSPESTDQLCDVIVAKLAKRGLGMSIPQAKSHGFESHHPLR